MKRHQIHLPEGVSFGYELATPFSRMIAVLLDVFCSAALTQIIMIPLLLLSIVSMDLMIAMATLGSFVVSIGYAIFLEWRHNGQTLGKRFMHLRVVSDDGLPLRLEQVVIRNLTRAADSAPALYALGGLIALLEPKGRRLGDLAAGTLVVRDAPVELSTSEKLGFDKYNALRGKPLLQSRLRKEIRPQEASLLIKALLRRESLDPQARVALFDNLWKELEPRCQIPEELIRDLPPEQRIRNIAEVLYR